MTNNQHFYQQLRSILEQESVVIATIVQVLGSAPREMGAKMAVCQNGSIIDTIGGGAGEGKVIKQALKVLETGEKQLVEIDLTGTPGNNIQGVCGGKVQVWLEKWSYWAIALVEEILKLFETGQSARLVTPFTKDTRPYLISERDFVGERKNSPYLQFVETIQPSPILLIIGGGHIAVYLAQIASLAGFQIVVQDDRPELITPQRFPQALLLSQSIDTALDTLTTHCDIAGGRSVQDGAGDTRVRGDLEPRALAFEDATQFKVAAPPFEETSLIRPSSTCRRFLQTTPTKLYVALVTRGYLQDIEALKALLQYPLAYQYIGAIGSTKRIHMIKQELQQQAIPITRLLNFYAPIGLDIGALTPEEIAISICGELIKVRRGGTGLSLCERMQDSKTPSKVHLSRISEKLRTS